MPATRRSPGRSPRASQSKSLLHDTDESNGTPTTSCSADHEVPDDPFIGLPLSVVVALLDAAGEEAEMLEEDGNFATLRPFQAALITLRILKLHDPEFPEAWLEWQEKVGSGELVAALRSQAWL